MNNERRLIVDPENNKSRIVKRSIEIMIEKFRSKKNVEKMWYS